MNFARTITIALPFADTVAAVRAALAAQGFGVISEIDMQATLHTKLGVDTDPYLILGACNPSLAHQALQADPRVGTLLPCNVVVAQTPTGCRVSAMDPMIMTSFDGTEALTPVATDADTRLRAVFAALPAQPR